MQKLEVKGFTKSFDNRKVVDTLSLDVKTGEVVGLLGPNGAGKTTTFYMIAGLYKPDAGNVYFNGEDITECPMYLRARRGISYLPQEASVFRKLTVEENILANTYYSNNISGSTDGIFTFDAVTKNYHSIDDQLRILRAREYVLEANVLSGAINNESKDEENKKTRNGVNYSLELKLSSDIFKINSKND